MNNLIPGLAGIALALTNPAWAAWQINLTPGVTPVSQAIYQLHMWVFWICVGIAVVVFAVLTYALIMHRKSRGAVAADFHEHAWLEVVWAVIPFVLLVIMAIPATRVLMMMEDTSEADITIKVIGHQWKWQYDYLDQNISFYSNLSTPLAQIRNRQPKNPWYLLEVDHPVVVPVNKKIRFLVTASDVIHSWWVPALGIKRDGVPGFIYEAWATIKTPGTYRGQCAELCGVNHGYMPIVVEAVDDATFKQWVKDKKQQAKVRQDLATGNDWSLPDLMELGEDIYRSRCAVCHRVDGTGMPPVFPALKASSVCVGRDIERHIDIVIHGIQGTAMLGFSPELNAAEIAAVVTYERNAFKNNTGDAVQPDQVQALLTPTVTADDGDTIGSEEGDSDAASVSEEDDGNTIRSEEGDSDAASASEKDDTNAVSESNTQ